MMKIDCVVRAPKPINKMSPIQTPKHVFIVFYIICVVSRRDL